MLLNKIRRGLAALGLAALSLTPAAPAIARSNGPALWEVKDKDTTVYLFGTIHLLPKDSQWRTPKFEKAVQGSQSLVVETIIDTGNPQKIAGIMSALGYSSGLPPIASRVPADKRAQLEAAITKTQIPRALFDRMETWMASFMLLGVQFQTLGVEGEQGVEAVLRQSFAAAGKQVGELETNQEQFTFFDRLPEDAQRKLLEGAIENPAEMKEQFGGMLQAWLSGDVDKIGNSFNRDLQSSPNLRPPSSPAATSTGISGSSAG